MKVGIPKEIKNNENRVGMTPAGVAELTRRGHASCHLAHGLQQGQGAVGQLYCLLGQADGTALQHGVCQFLLAGKMEVGEQ